VFEDLGKIVSSENTKIAPIKCNTIASRNACPKTLGISSEYLGGIRKYDTKRYLSTQYHTKHAKEPNTNTKGSAGAKSSVMKRRHINMDVRYST